MSKALTVLVAIAWAPAALAAAVAFALCAICVMAVGVLVAAVNEPEV